MLGVFWTPPENTVQKHIFWASFNLCQAATLSPLFFFNPALLSRAALYTLGVVGSLSYVGATARYAELSSGAVASANLSQK
jgi:growth hormone-inducible transmembrane protein